MSDEPFLILHKVRGVPAFDIAEKLICPECNLGDGMVKEEYCEGCNDEGFWWIIPTSGHRAHPLRYWALNDIFNHIESSDGRIDELSMIDELHRTDLQMLMALPDHYPTRSSPSTPSLDLISALGIKPSVPTDFKRRV